MIWRKCLPLLKQGRPDDLRHASKVAGDILNYSKKIRGDLNVLVPVAMMHDIGHAAILPEHFKYITGEDKIINGKLVHMLAGAKIAKKILREIKYDIKKSKEIVDIISTHDADQLTGINVKKIYNTKNKKIFHDIDALDRYNEKRMKAFAKLYKNRENMLRVLEKMLNSFFLKEFAMIARDNIAKIAGRDKIC
jgi:HD superfamily phosphodiesterase